MTIEWKIKKVDDILIRCPYCNHKTAPPEYPYCDHTIFVYVAPSSDEEGFDLVTSDFAVRYLNELKSFAFEYNEEMEISLESEKQFLKGELPAFHHQKIKLLDNLIKEYLLPLKTKVYDFTEKDGYHPCRIVVAFSEVRKDYTKN